MPSRPDGLLRAFCMSALQINDDLSSIEREYGINLGHSGAQSVKRKVSEYAQFEAHMRLSAARMSEMYEVFFCLENSIRQLVKATLLEFEGANWWDSSRVDDARIRKPAADRRKKEIDSGVTPRSDELIHYTTFGELSQLITDNWDLFDAIFESKSAVSNVSNQLNLLRGPIAHCNVTDDLEWDRLGLAVRTWFRIMS